MHALALELGYFCTRSSEFLSNLAFRIASSIGQRRIGIDPIVAR